MNHDMDRRNTEGNYQLHCHATVKNAIDIRYWIPADHVQHYILGPCFKKGITSEVQRTCTHFMNSASDMVSHVCSSTKIITKCVKLSYETTSMGITPDIRTIACSTNHNSSLPTDSDFDDDTTTISQAIKKRRITPSNTDQPGPIPEISNLALRIVIVDDSTPSHTIFHAQENLTISHPTNTTLLVSATKSMIDSHPVIIIGPSWTENEMPIGPNSEFNSHIITEDITDTEVNSNVDNFLIDHDPTSQNPDGELALMNDSELHMTGVVEPHVFAYLESFFNQYSSAQVINTQLIQTDKKKIDAVKKVLLEIVGIEFDIITEEEEHLVEELKAKLDEADDIYGYMWCSI
ncbi:hypothetical protein FNV43_RR04528 [Rhamnella rubrinervis]|uniref:Uncharacterized protein n=1 Tax=Rhamnella rubrinervis TaxID=2594499 RepID=A0A8K0HJP8_9ROSA|nr:hypothetical protein FNV43_RR04528 [Rhamnella rubrinervis]